MLLKPTSEQIKIIEGKLERSGMKTGNRQHAGHAENRIFYQILQSVGFQDSRNGGQRASIPNYTVLGFDRVASKPTKADIMRYSEVTNGADLTKEGLITQALFFDNDLITDRYAVASFSLLVDLANKYLGRGNDFNHNFDARQARSRIIDVNIGTDPGTALHPDTPIEALQTLSPNSPVTSTYAAFYGTLAFPKLNENGGAWGANTIESVQSGMIRDLSLAWALDGHSLCSICLSPMETFWFWEYCGEHGFPGGRTDDGTAVVAIMQHAADAFTFGLVSDGAVKRAGLVLDPTMNQPEMVPMAQPMDDMEEIAKFQVGDRVEVVGDPHMEGQDAGTVKSVVDTIAYGIEFDSEPGVVHKWYIEDEIEPEQMDDTSEKD
jgi:hypothetical protein